MIGIAPTKVLAQTRLFLCHVPHRFHSRAKRPFQKTVISYQNLNWISSRVTALLGEHLRKDDGREHYGATDELPKGKDVAKDGVAAYRADGAFEGHYHGRNRRRRPHLPQVLEGIGYAAREYPYVGNGKCGGGKPLRRVAGALRAVDSSLEPHMNTFTASRTPSAQPAAGWPQGRRAAAPLRRRRPARGEAPALTPVLPRLHPRARRTPARLQALAP